MRDPARTRTGRCAGAPPPRTNPVVVRSRPRLRPTLALAILLLGSVSCGDGTTEPVMVVDPVAADRAALVALYEATNGPNWVDSEGWLTDAPLGEWHGVKVDAGGRVVRLKLYGEELTGTIPPELGNLTSLEWLTLRGNLTGAIPPELGNLTSLQRLYLTNNELTGAIPPELGNLTSIESLFLGYNALTGAIPPELGNMSSLKWLDLPGNALTGPIPPELGNISGLYGLFLNDNTLTGSIPESFLGIRGLHRFYIAGNESLCVPNSVPFLEWLQPIEYRDAEPPLCVGGSAAERRESG